MFGSIYPLLDYDTFHIHISTVLGSIDSVTLCQKEGGWKQKGKMCRPADILMGAKQNTGPALGSMNKESPFCEDVPKSSSAPPF